MNAITERRLVLFLMVCAGVLRCWQLELSPVEHFDEGVYASNFWFTAEEGYRYPDRHLYAPPLLPMLIEWGHLVWGPGLLACLIPSLLAGILTVPLIWLFVRRIAGPLGGVCAAALWTFQDMAILYSRTALTESLLCFWMLLAVLLAERLLTACREQNRTAVSLLLLAGGSGLAAGLAWLTKYNGWLTLAIILSASFPWGICSKLDANGWRRTLGALLALVAVAWVLWWPYLNSLQPVGGYASVAANHRQYFGGLSGWGASLGLQGRNFWLLASGVGLCGPACCALLLWTYAGRPRVERDAISSHPLQWTNPGLWLIASWWCGLSVAIPLYHPYPRLLLPWILSSCLGLGVLCQWWGTNGWPFRRSPEQSPRLGIACPEAWSQGGVFLLLGVAVLLGPLWRSSAWQDRRSLQQISAEFVRQAGTIASEQGFAENQTIFYVYGEPALFYHLSAADRLAGPIGHLDFALAPRNNVRVPTFLVVGPHAERSPLFQQQWTNRAEAFRLVAEQNYLPSRFIQLNERAAPNSRPLRVALYQVVWPATE